MITFLTKTDFHPIILLEGMGNRKITKVVLMSPNDYTPYQEFPSNGWSLVGVAKLRY